MTKKEILDKIDEVRKEAAQEIAQVCLERDERIAALRAELREVENAELSKTNPI